MKVLVTGGAGYIGSHTTLGLLQAGFEVVVLDNLCNASAESLRRVAHLAGRTPVFVEGDIRDRILLDKLLAHYPVQAVVHFAGLKAVGESVAHPLRYYDNNVGGTVTLCQAKPSHGGGGRVHAGIQFVGHSVWRPGHRTNFRRPASRPHHQPLWP